MSGLLSESPSIALPASNGEEARRSRAPAGAHSHEASLLGDLIFVSLENWDEIWRRNQFVVAELASRSPDSRILFVGLPHDLSALLRARKWRQLLRSLLSRRAPITPMEELPNIKFSRPVKLLPNWSIGTRINQALFRRHIRWQARHLGMAYPLLWLNPHWAGHLAGTLEERLVVYDITDDWALADAKPSVSALIRQQDAYLCDRADLVIVCSESLRRSRARISRRLLLLPNGVDIKHYSDIVRLNSGRPVRRAPAPEARDWASPVFGYTGTLHPDRSDVELILAVATAFPRGTVALVGPEQLSVRDRERLLAVGNVRLVGPVPYSRVPDFMSAFDVCIVPHRESPFVESLNPIKLWEFLAAGKPIVSSDVAGFRDYPALCRIASGSGPFVAACQQALDEATELSRGEPEAVALAAARKSEAADHTWIARVDVLLKELQDVGDRKGKEPTQPLWKPPFHLRLTRAANRYWRLAWMRTMNRRARFGAGCDIRRGSTLVMERNGWVEFGPNCILDRFLTVECVGVLRVGANVIFGHNCTIAARESILIGDDCLIAEMVSIRDHDHRLDRLDVPTRDQGAVCSPVRIGRNVWLGSKVTVLKGVTIGENAVIGANSVVTRDIPANAVAVGAPAKVIRFRTQGGI